MDHTCELIEMAEDGVISWEAIARECLAQMNVDECQSVRDTLLDE